MMLFHPEWRASIFVAGRGRVAPPAKEAGGLQNQRMFEPSHGAVIPAPPALLVLCFDAALPAFDPFAEISRSQHASHRREVHGLTRGWHGSCFF